MTALTIPYKVTCPRLLGQQQIFNRVSLARRHFKSDRVIGKQETTITNKNIICAKLKGTEHFAVKRPITRQAVNLFRFGQLKRGGTIPILEEYLKFV